MTWVLWRQYRVTVAIAGAILAAFAVLLLVTGLQDAARWHAALVTCAKDGTCANLSQTVSLGSGPLNTLAVLTLAVPLVFGMFWGGPAVARERETGTMQLAWTQSVTRRHWLSVKVAWLLLAGAVFGGAVAGIVATGRRIQIDRIGITLGEAEDHERPLQPGMLASRVGQHLDVDAGQLGDLDQPFNLIAHDISAANQAAQYSFV
jgi:hypothetical protein